MTTNDRKKYLEDNRKVVDEFLDGYKDLIVSDLGRGSECVLEFEDIRKRVEILKKPVMSLKDFEVLTGMICTETGIENVLEDYGHNFNPILKNYFTDLVSKKGEIQKGQLLMSVVDFVASNLELHIVTKVVSADGKIFYLNYADFKDEPGVAKTYYIASGYAGKGVRQG